MVVVHGLYGGSAAGKLALTTCIVYASAKLKQVLSGCLLRSIDKQDLQDRVSAFLFGKHRIGNIPLK
jgi:hypothetical protein